MKKNQEKQIRVISDLFGDSVSGFDCRALNVVVITNELEGMRKEPGRTYLSILSPHSLGSNEERLHSAQTHKQTNKLRGP
jgi:hypothetical protein